MNWSAVARDHSVTGGNAGQVVKEFASSLGLSTSNSSTLKRKQRTQSKKKKTRLPGSDISIPANPSVAAVE